MLIILGTALLAGGAVLLFLGLRASDSFASGVTRLFSGSPTKESVLLLTAGAAVAGAGLVVLCSAPRGRTSKRGRAGSSKGSIGRRRTKSR